LQNQLISNELDNSNTIQTSWILLGSLSAFSFSIISSMILSRYFDKADYGTYKQVIYVYNTLLIVFTLGLPKAYSFFLPRVKIEEAKKVISKINLILLISGLILSIMLFSFSKHISLLLDNERLYEPLKYFAAVPLLMLPTMGLESILATFKKAKFIAYYNITTRILMLCLVVIPVVLFKGDILTAIKGFIIASLISFIIALKFKYYPVKHVVNSTDSKITYLDILKYSSPIMIAGIWGMLIRFSDQFFISRYFGVEVFADFSNGSLQLPFVAMIISAGSIVLAPIYSKKVATNNTNTILSLWTSVFEKTIKLTYPLVIFSFVFSKEIMMVLYGHIYENSGSYFQIKLIVNFFTIIAYGPLLLNIGGEKYYAKVHMFGAFLLIILQWISIKLFNDPIVIIYVSVFCEILRILLMLVFIAKYFKIKFNNLIPYRLIMKLIIPAFIIILTIKLFYNLFEIDILTRLIFSFFTYLILFLLWAGIAKINYKVIFRPIFLKFKSL